MPAERRLSVAWIVVVAITLVYLVLDRSTEDDGVLAANSSATVAAVVLALAKLRVIMREFMDVRHAPRVLRTLTDALVIVMGAALLGTYVIGTAIG